jgi:hypothetical protein
MNDVKPLKLSLSLGNASLSLKHIKLSELERLPPESFRVLSFQRENVLYVMSNGLPLDSHRHKNISFNKEDVHYGAITAAYYILELFGFAFLHPLEPIYPHQLAMNASESLLNVTETPYWPERAFHIHTQHPLELTEVLQGHDIPTFGPHGAYCEFYTKSKGGNAAQSAEDLEKESLKTSKSKSSFSSASPSQTSSFPTQDSFEKKSAPYCERWEDMVDDVDLLFEWAIANRLNKLEWLLLGSFKWGDFDVSDVRHKRLQVLTNLGHAYSLMIGADVPLGNIQQHAWYMVNVRLPFEQQVIDNKSSSSAAASFCF